MTYKFKIGDHVKILPNPYGDTFGHEGETATVTSHGYSPDIRLDESCTIHEEVKCQADCWNEDCLELDK